MIDSFTGLGRFEESRWNAKLIRGIGVYVGIFFDDGLSMSFEDPPVPPG